MISFHELGDADLRLGEVVVAHADGAQHPARGGLLEAVGDVAAAGLDVGLAGGAEGVCVMLRSLGPGPERGTAVSAAAGPMRTGALHGSAAPRHRRTSTSSAPPGPRSPQPPSNRSTAKPEVGQPSGIGSAASGRRRAARPAAGTPGAWPTRSRQPTSSGVRRTTFSSVPGSAS